MRKDPDMVSAQVFLDLSKDKSFTDGEREVFRRLAFARGAARIEIETEKPRGRSRRPRQKKTRPRQERA